MSLTPEQRRDSGVKGRAIKMAVARYKRDLALGLIHIKKPYVPKFKRPLPKRPKYPQPEKFVLPGVECKFDPDRVI